MAKILLGIACNRQIKTQTLESIFGIVNKSPHDLGLNIATRGFTISENRNVLAAQAVRDKYDYLLFIDDDMNFEPDLLDKLLAHQKDIVGVAYHPRFKVDKGTVQRLDKTHIITLKGKESKELFECKAVGTGIMLIKTDIFLKIPQPWFKMKTHKCGLTLQGEDWYFCYQARKAGFSVWCDPQREVGHIGYYIF